MEILDDNFWIDITVKQAKNVNIPFDSLTRKLILSCRA